MCVHVTVSYVCVKDCGCGLSLHYVVSAAKCLPCQVSAPCSLRGDIGTGIIDIWDCIQPSQWDATSRYLGPRALTLEWAGWPRHLGVLGFRQLGWESQLCHVLSMTSVSYLNILTLSLHLQNGLLINSILLIDLWENGTIHLKCLEQCLPPSKELKISQLTLLLFAIKHSVIFATKS